MLSPSGTLRFTNLDLTISPSLRRADLLASPAAAAASVEPTLKPWSNYRLDHCISALNFAVHLIFRGENLVEVTLCEINADRYGASWAEYTEAHQREHIQSHADWLAACNIRQGSYPWGSVWTGWDNNGAGTSIVIRYTH